MSRTEIRLSGAGGQGIVLAGQILGQAASLYEKGKSATLTQSYGPEARGGSCSAEVVISNESVGYPYVISPQVLVIMSQEAYNKYTPGLSPETLVIIDPDLVKPGTSRNANILSIPATSLAREMGRVVVANIVMLGFLAAVSDVVSAKALKESILATVPKGTGEFNIQAFTTGYEYGQKHGKKS
ncbi:MAG: 2-oxoacid:acceptor oxidoreductase family protein [Dehalococcoidia bacterium]|nr:2-oxoacid:acceptor oxidoreductase family protein [Dehalococcoidia bacterium]